MKNVKLHSGSTSRKLTCSYHYHLSRSWQCLTFAGIKSFTNRGKFISEQTLHDYKIHGP